MKNREAAKPFNKKFAEYATSVAFSVWLTKNQCQILLRVRRSEGLDHYLFHVHQARRLVERGLISYTPKKQGLKLLYALTPAGLLLCQLLDEAGITLENSKTKTTERELAFWARCSLLGQK